MLSWLRRWVTLILNTNHILGMSYGNPNEWPFIWAKNYTEFNKLWLEFMKQFTPEEWQAKKHGWNDKGSTPRESHIRGKDEE